MKRPYLALFAPFLLTSLLACTEPPSAVAGGSGDTECEPGDVEECDCGDDQPEGEQTCRMSGRWSSCACESVPVEFGNCKPGRYEGEFFGYYFSSFTGATAPIPVWALAGIDGKPGLAFTLNAEGEELIPGQEFGGELTISDGYVEGTANGLFPFKAKLEGKLDCATKEFKATMIGGYAILISVPGLTTVDFEGPVRGKYDVETSSFPCDKKSKAFPKCDGLVEERAINVVGDAVAGTKFPNPDYPSTWDLTEKTGLTSPYPDIPLGGRGYWSAEWVGAGSVDIDTGMMKP